MDTLLSNSIRRKPVEIILGHQKFLKNYAGISRITELTYLDRIGIPVFISIRPLGRILCVNSGKGMTQKEAEVGALMEGVEFSTAEKINQELETSTMSISLYESDWKKCCLEFCPPLGKKIDLDKEIEWTYGTELNTNKKVPVPSELVYINPDIERVFGSDTNGLASGSDTDEALLHGLCEVAERHIKSIQTIKPNLTSIHLHSLPIELQALSNKILKSGISLNLRFFFNELKIPCFQAMTWDKDVASTKYINTGFGCHPIPEIAASRAITEAVQSRLLYIHGGRDDLAYVKKQANTKFDSEHQAIFWNKISAISKVEKNTFCFIESLYKRPSKVSINTLLEHVIAKFYNSGLKQIIAVELNTKDFPVKVIRTIVPEAENLTPQLQKFGRILLEYYEK